jgi:pantetheine-phosphate adenylyltransferase
VTFSSQEKKDVVNAFNYNAFKNIVINSINRCIIDIDLDQSQKSLNTSANLEQIDYRHKKTFTKIQNSGNRLSVADFKKIISLIFTKVVQYYTNIVNTIATGHTEDPKTTTGAVLCDADLYELIHGDFNTLLKNEMLISKEYQMFHEKDYVAGRLSFLSKWVDRNPHIKDLNEYLKVRKLNVGIYPGTFDPFHVGHLNILLKAERIFDKVIIAFGRNPSKDKLAEDTIPEPEKFGFRRVISIDESLAKTIANEGMPTLIRGVRNSQDLNHEMTQNKFVQEMLQSTREENELKVVFIPCDEKYRLISSTALNSLKRVDEGMYKRYLAFC